MKTQRYLSWVVWLWLPFFFSSIKATDEIEKHRGPDGEWPLMFDGRGSEFMGASLMLSLNNAFFFGEDRLIDATGITLSQPWGGILRGVELVGLVLPVNDLAFLMQHEYFGHGARAREFSIKSSLPKIQSLPMPFGPGLASVSHAPPHNNKESLVLTLGGVEGAMVLAEEINTRWWHHKKMNVKTTFMNILATHNTDGYLWIFPPSRMPAHLRPGHDMVAYIEKVNKMYGDQRLTLDYMNWSVATNLINPYSFFSFYSMYRYVLYGERTNGYPYFTLGDFSFLPVMRYVLAPFGPEFQLHNFMSLGERDFKTYIRYGKLTDSNYFGLGVLGDIYSRWNMTLGAKFHTWRQPAINANSFGQDKLGASGSATLNYHPADFISLNGILGYKSAGFVLGEPIDQSLIWRAGLTIHL